ncbi:MAG: type II toxin-antitoxin system HicA family toxin [Chitinophagaceae bacterium]
MGAGFLYLSEQPIFQTHTENNKDVKDTIRKLEKEGWILVRQKRIHKQYRHPDKAELITIPDHGNNEELAIGVAEKIKKIANLK